MNPKRQPHQATSHRPGEPAVSDVVGNGAAQPDGAPEDIAPESGEGAAGAAPSGSGSSVAEPSDARKAGVFEEADMPAYMDAAVEAELGFEAQALEPDSGGAERRVELDLDELAARAGKADEYLQLAQRTRADFENYRKRATREVAAAQERGVARLAKELLPAIDNLDRAVQASIEAVPESDQPAPGPDAQLISGIRLVHADVIAALARVGIEPYSPEGEQFDPQYHEAVAQAPIEGSASGTVVEVYQVGYRIGEMVLRPARVLVAA